MRLPEAQQQPGFTLPLCYSSWAIKLRAQLRHLWFSLQATKPHCSGLLLIDIYKANTRGLMGVGPMKSFILPRALLAPDGAVSFLQGGPTTGRAPAACLPVYQHAS